MINAIAKVGEAFVPASAGGNYGAVQGLIAGHSQRLRVFLYRLLGEAASADALAERVLLSLLRSGRFAAGENFAVTMYRLTLSMAAKSGPQRAQPPSAEDCGDPQLRRVLRGLFQLPLQQRAAVLMHRYESFGISDIASILGMTEAAARQLVVAGYRALSGPAGSYND